MKQRSYSEWRFLGFAAVAMMLAVALFLAAGALAQQGRVLEPVREVPRAAAPGGGNWRLLDPLRYENLSIFPVVARQQFDTAGFLTLDEGLASGEVLVTERGSEEIRRSRGPDASGRGAHPTFPLDGPHVEGGVQSVEQHRRRQDAGATVNTLVLVNRSKRPLLLLAGEVVTGGKQDRIIGKDRIVPPGAEPLPLDVFCVERGRWSAGNAFKASNLMAHPSVREKAAVAKKQGEVWDAVRRGSTSDQAREYAFESRSAAGAALPTAPRMSTEALNTVIIDEARSESYARVYQSPTVVATVDSFAAEVERRFRDATKEQRVVGVVVAYGGEVAWSDVFASDALFRRYWPKLLRSYVVEAVARPRLQEKASLADAQRFLAPLEGREQIETEPGVYRWREITEGRLAQIEIESLLGKAFVLHRVKVQRAS
ncbi:MAG: ARPP-1 family domain-containing protein [Candidatus Acidiferrales bacterium]